MTKNLSDYICKHCDAELEIDYEYHQNKGDNVARMHLEELSLFCTNEDCGEAGSFGEMVMRRDGLIEITPDWNRNINMKQHEVSFTKDSTDNDLLNELKKTDDMTEDESHPLMDDIIITFLIVKGFKKSADYFERRPKWYA